MTNPADNPIGAFGSSRGGDQPRPWRWKQFDAQGRETGEQGPSFPTRSDAESWLGEVYPDLAEAGVASVTLLEDDREVYGPMSLEAG